MFSYQPPLKDIRFVLTDLLGASNRLAQLAPFAEIDDDLMMQVAEEAGRFASEVLFPLNAVGDLEGCHYENGVVSTPSGFAEAYRQFQKAGWPALACDPAFGGQGLPNTLNSVLYEMLSSSNHAWTMYPGLLHGAYACLHKHASDDLKQRYLPRVVSGEWLATMCLTEAHAGSDLGLLRTRAVPQDDGTVRITGSKIFISGGEQDMTPNIVHLVLARLPDAPAGSKGISLFLVPKFLPDGEGLGKRNAVTCTGIEHKMGIHGSATSSLQFDDAIGWLVGEPNKGLSAMFVMMNAARLSVGIQGLGSAETAYQNSLKYAQERLQMRAANRPAQQRGEPADPIIMHPAMQRLLMTQRAYVEGFRMLAYFSALSLDAAEHHPDASVRQEMDAQLALLTPIIKSMMTDQGFHGSSQALQIYGGHGFITETGIEQYVRDSRIAMIYEGTNEIQAVDLLLRKIMADGAKQLGQLFGQISKTIEQENNGPMHKQAQTLAALISRIEQQVEQISRLAGSNPELPHQIAPEMLRLVGHCVIAWLWLRAATVARNKMQADRVFYQAKQETAQYYFDFVLPETTQQLQIVDNVLKSSLEGRQTNLLSDVMRQYADPLS